MRVSKAMAGKLVGKITTRTREPRTKRKPDMRPLERSIQKDILNYLRMRSDVWVVRVNSAGVKVPSGNGPARFFRSNDRPGCPDILMCFQGRFVGIEVKRPGESPTTQQTHCHYDIRQAGGIVIVARSLQDVVDWIDAARKR